MVHKKVKKDFRKRLFRFTNLKTDKVEDWQGMWLEPVSKLKKMKVGDIIEFKKNFFVKRLK